MLDLGYVKQTEDTEMKLNSCSNMFLAHFDCACPFKIYEQNNNLVKQTYITKGILESRKNIQFYAGVHDCNV